MDLNKVRDLLDEMEKLEKTSTVDFTMEDISEAKLVIKYDKGETGGTVELDVSDTHLEMILKDYEATKQELVNDLKGDIAQELGIEIPAAPAKKKRTRNKTKKPEVAEQVEKLEKATETVKAEEDAEPCLPEAPVAAPVGEVIPVKEEAPVVTEPVKEEAPVVTEPVKEEAPVVTEPVKEEAPAPVEKKAAKVVEKKAAAAVKPKAFKLGNVSGFPKAESNILILNGIDKELNMEIADVIGSFYDAPEGELGYALISCVDEAVLTEEINTFPAGKVMVLTDVKLSIAKQIKDELGSAVATVLVGGTAPQGSDIMSYLREIHNTSDFKYDFNLHVTEEDLKKDKTVAIEQYAFAVAPFLGFSEAEEVVEPAAVKAAPVASDIEV